MTQAALGAEIDVPTLDKPVKQTASPRARSLVKPCCASSGQGVPRLQRHRQGRPVRHRSRSTCPRKLTEKQKELLRQFDASMTGKEYEGKKSFFDRMKDAF